MTAGCVVELIGQTEAALRFRLFGSLTFVILATWETDWEDCGSSPAWAKKFARLHLKQKKVGMVACTYHPSYRRKLKIGGSKSRPA
jgi:hypothetical protein